MRAATVHTIVLLAAFAGLLVSGWAAYESTHPALQGTCTVTAFFSCAAVDTSGHTTTFGAPDWAIGIGGFVLLIALDVPLYLTWKRPWLLAVTGAASVGLLTSLYFAYIELAIIHAFCLVCFSAYVANAVVLAGAVQLLRSGRGGREDDATVPARPDAA